MDGMRDGKIRAAVIFWERGGVREGGCLERGGMDVFSQIRLLADKAR
jgi:hypothetical protein